MCVTFPRPFPTLSHPSTSLSFPLPFLPFPFTSVAAYACCRSCNALVALLRFSGSLLFYLQLRRYMSYSWGDFEVSRPAGEIGRGGVDRRSSKVLLEGQPTHPRQISPQTVQEWGVGTKLKFLRKFRIRNIKATQGRIPRGRFLPTFKHLWAWTPTTER